MTFSLKDQFRKLSQRWRKTAEQTRPLQDVTTDPLMRGHLQGVSDGLLIAADDVDKVLSEPNGKVTN